jgi:predicted dehydrogenase
MNDSTRRDLFRLAATGALATVVEENAQAQKAQTMGGVPFDRKPTVRLGVVGVGGRGSGLVNEFTSVPGGEITALCDIVKDKVLKAQSNIERRGKQSKSPALYYSGDRAFEELVKRDDVDLVVAATPWNWHVPMAVAAMKAGKHVAVEVPAARTLEECWQLVNTSESTRRHCIQLENCCYGYNEMLVLNMVRADKFGEITHGGAAYNHDLRSILFSNEGEGLWRRFEHFKRDGNLYPTHGLGPVARYMNINHGDRFEYLVSVSTMSASLAAYRKEHLPADDPRQKESYRCGDLNVSLIRTAKGRVITLEHNVSSPQPYDRINLIAGTKGIFRDYPPRIYLDGDKHEEFGPIDPFKAQFEHALWKETGELARKLGGHGGMDFVMAYRLVQCMREGLPPDIDVYDAASWSAPGPLSEASVAKGGAPVQFPDFTRGKWKV